jgi:hypothetical protein
MNQWSPKETSTHQDHVIAHVVGATVLGYFILDEALHIVLDMGFVWTIYLDGQMLLLPQVAAINELEVAAEMRNQLSREIDLLAREGRLAVGLQRITPAPLDCLISEVEFYANDAGRRLILKGEEADLIIETSLETAEIQVSASQ